MKANLKTIAALLAACSLGCCGVAQAAADPDPLAWPSVTRECRPWAYWWWMGSAVDPTNLTRELRRYHDAGMGGVHIIPIYGAKGWEDKYIEYLSPKWMEMLRHTVSEARRLGMDVDMTTGTGWCFGGPQVTDAEANASVVVRTFDLGVGERLKEGFKRESIQALVAFGPNGKSIDLTESISTNGEVFFSPPGNWIGPEGSAPPKTWKVYAISQKPSGQKVKRASLGGGGHMLNLIYPAAMQHYLQWFDEAFANYTGPKPRAMYHDSYEYRSEWAPDFFAQFEKRRGYRLQTELPALFGKEENDRVARVKCDYRETISDIMAEETLPRWANWSYEHGFITRNQAHGSPGNLLDLYAAADVPETEMFHTDRDLLVSKFASSAAHVTAKRLVASETGTWLEEHFTEKLADMKYLLDDLFLAGVNHVIYHGTCYSPDEAGWPGWHFYASFEMNPRNSIWRDVPALNAYAARCQSVLQSGQPDNDILLYWPIHDRWHNAKGMVQNFTVHARDWLDGQSVGRLARQLWTRGFAFDYVSDRQLAEVKFVVPPSGGSDAGSRLKAGLQTGGATYRVVAVPACEHLPVKTLEKLLALAEAGVTVIFEKQLPQDVPGWGDLEKRRARFRTLLGRVNLADAAGGNLKEAKLGAGRVLVGDPEAALAAAAVPRETMVDNAGLLTIRRRSADGRCYFIANRGEQPFDGWITPVFMGDSVVMLDPMTGRTGIGSMRKGETGQVHLQLQPGESVILRCLVGSVTGRAWASWKIDAQPTEIAGTWQVKFIEGGPTLPPDFQTAKLASWTEFGSEEAQRFAGTARYTITFDAPARTDATWLLDLGKVSQSARVRLNGRELGTLLIPPFRVALEELKPKSNLLEVEATNVSANRIRDLDRRKVNWKVFNDINFVNLNYRPFDASDWPLTESGLLGPVTLRMATPLSQR